MRLRIKKSLYSRHANPILKEAKRKIFIVCEGDKTEVRYFEGLIEYSKELGINELLDIIIMDKNPESRGITHASGLIDLARTTIDKLKCGEGGTYYEDEDEFLIVLDRDKENFKEYNEFIDEFKDEFILAITNPCFELWLLLHIRNSVDEIINLNYEEILSNKKISNKHTFISRLLSDKLHMNPKSGMKFSKFRDQVLYAIKQEEKLEQDLYYLENKIGSNIGKIIKEEMLDDKY